MAARELPHFLPAPAPRPLQASPSAARPNATPAHAAPHRILQTGSLLSICFDFSFLFLFFLFNTCPQGPVLNKLYCGTGSSDILEVSYFVMVKG